MKPRKYGIWLNVNRLGVPPPFLINTAKHFIKNIGLDSLVVVIGLSLLNNIRLFSPSMEKEDGDRYFICHTPNIPVKGGDKRGDSQEVVAKSRLSR